MGKKGSYVSSLRDLINLKERGHLSDEEFETEKSNLLSLYQNHPTHSGSEDRTDHELVDIPDGVAVSGFVISYIVFVAPTYLLPYLGSNSTISNALWASIDGGMLPQFWLHFGCLMALVQVAWRRGSITNRPWLPALPAVATAFDLVPGMNLIPLVPTVLHIGAIVAGSSARRIRERPANLWVQNLFAGAWLCVMLLGLYRTDIRKDPSVGQGISENQAEDVTDFSTENALTDPENAEPDELINAGENPETYDPAEPSSVANAVAETKARNITLETLRASITKALNDGEAVRWSANGNDGYIAVSDAVRSGSRICRTVSVNAAGGAHIDADIPRTWCATDGSLNWSPES